MYSRVLLEYYRRQAHGRGIRDGRTGTLTVIQRFGGGLNLSVHFHTLVLDGVFSRALGAGLAFFPTVAPSGSTATSGDSPHGWPVRWVVDPIRTGVPRISKAHAGYE
ncbi:MAG: transposase [Thermoanaerobaculia bacterium]